MSKKFDIIVADPPWLFQDSLKMSDVKRGADANYNTMSILDIKQLPVNAFADPSGALLALWVPSSLLQEGLDTMKAWGFVHKQTYVWVKIKKEPYLNLSKDLKRGIMGAMKLFRDISEIDVKECLESFSIANVSKVKMFKLINLLSFGMGRLFRQTHEICLIGTNNNKIYKKLENKSQRSVSFGENLKHSAKPEHLQNSLEIMFPKANKLELFARRKREGWICLGNEICDGEDIRVSLAKLL